MLKLTETVRNREEFDYDDEEADREENGQKADIATVFDYHRQAKAIVQEFCDAHNCPIDFYSNQNLLTALRRSVAQARTEEIWAGLI